MVSIRVDDNNIVVAYGEILGDYTPFPDGIVVDVGLDFFLEHFDAGKSVKYNVDGTLSTE